MQFFGFSDVIFIFVIFLKNSLLGFGYLNFSDKCGIMHVFSF